ncbi:hypothetical protein [Duganella sp. FT27W]|uniref:hypothetical protein n=1 Tax=Duganella sp. FT27W TaxID=2654636 RepID=UPI00186B7760|nr:hypothetical protein [Duganella sp. FT27W]
MGIAEQVDVVLSARRTKLPVVREKQESLVALTTTLSVLDDALAGLVKHPQTPAELRGVIATADLQSCKDHVQVAVDEMTRVQARFSRPTINLGVSGQARVGKSTLLQALSGLSEEAIPTGTGNPVTAVRSRILSSTERVARLRMHSWATFRDEVLKPYHDDLRLGPVPATLEDFRRRDYPTPGPDDENTRGVMLKRLRRMRDSLASYAEHLNGADRVISDFSALRAWIAYPKRDTAAQEDNRYLAVREATIECPFPDPIARSIGLIDLPGLGEIAASAEAHHVQGLRDDVDFVVLVKRANEGMAFWTKQDGLARKLIDEARKPISNTADFLGILSNEGGVPDETLQEMLASIRLDANVGLEHAPITLFRCQGKDPASVGLQLLEPVLAHLVDRLPVMDQEVLEQARILANTACEHVGNHLQALEAAMTASLPETGGVTEKLSELTTQMRQLIARDLVPILESHRISARTEADDATLTVAIRAAHAQIKSWADDALGTGEAAWIDKALGEFAVNRDSSNLAMTELNRIRVHIGEVYCGLDEQLAAQTHALFDEVGGILVERCGRLMHGLSGREALERLAVLLTAGDETCVNLQRATNELSSLKVSYRSHFHPVVRARLDILEHRYLDPETQTIKLTIDVPGVDVVAARHLLSELRLLAIKASASVRDGLLRESSLMDKIIHAAVEQFDDSFIRSGTSKKEFHRFARSWRDELFPGKFDAIATSRIDARQVKAAFAGARSAIDKLKVKAQHE